MARTVTSKDYYYWYKENGICVNCRQQKALEGETQCLACKMDRREQAKDYYNSLTVDEKRKHNLSSAIKKQWCRENGICYYCYKRPVEKEKKMCSICLAKNRQRARKYRLEHGSNSRDLLSENNVCSFCGSPATHGYRTCPKCRERCVNNLPITRDNSDHIWRKMIKADVARIKYNKKEKEI